MSLRSRRLARPRALDAAIAPLIEQLESRRMLAINPVGAPVTGTLSGKIVFSSPGHGWQYSSTLGRFATDRGDNNEIVEDFGNQDQFTFYADYVLRAGGTFVPMRPVGHQTNEVVLDNDSAGVTYSGAWSNSTSTIFYDEDYGAAADAVPYRFASTNAASETASATYTPNIPQAGYYPIYTWVRSGTDRTSQLYKINHTGGQSQIRVDHSMVGNGWIYLGSYYFNAGSSPTAGSVQISNQGTGSKVVIADAIRFGNGMGDLPSGAGGIGTGSISGYPREDENSYHWLYRSMGQGVTPSSIIGTGNVSAPSNMAQYMNVNTNPFGTSVYIGFHSNAGGGRGARGLIDADVADRTPHQTDLALYLGRQINTDMQALNSQWEYAWNTGTTHTFNGQFGELDLGSAAEMDATIIEVAFHDSVEDAAIMRDPKGRDQIARSVYEGTLEYFQNWGGLVSPVAVPSAPINVRAVSNTSGQVTLNWSAGPTGVKGAAASGYRVYTSLDGYGFDGGTAVATTSVTITGLDPNLPHYFKVVATNAGGESHESEVLAALPSGGAKRVLIVNGYDRFDRNNDVRYPYAFIADGLVDRVYPRQNNTFDYAVQVASAIHAAQPGTHVAATSNEAVINGSVDLTQYSTVVWILGEESTADDTLNATEQTKVEQFIANGGNLFVTGGEIGWDLDQQNNGRSFYETSLKGNYVADDAATYNVAGVAGGIFAGLSFSFDNGTQFYNTDFPDVIAPQAGAVTALNYSGGAGGGAGIIAPGVGRRGNVILFGFPFETITTAAARTQVMGAVLNYFGSAATNTPDLAAATDSGSNTADNITNFNNVAGKQLQFAVDNAVVGSTLDLYDGNTLLASKVATAAATTFTFAGTVSNAVHLFTVRQSEPGKGSTPSLSLSVRIDTVAPTAALSSQTPTNGASTFDFTITYNDSSALVDPSTFGDDDITVLGPDNTPYIATLIDAGIPGSGGNRVATYRMSAPGGTWDGPDAGIYTVVQNAAGVADFAGNYRAAGTVGTFDVSPPPFAYLVGNVLHVDYQTAGNSVALVVNGSNLDVTQDGTTLSFANGGFNAVILHGTSGNDTLNFTGPVAQAITFDGGAGNDQLNVLGGTFTFAADAVDDADALGVQIASGAAIIFDATQHLRDLNVDGTATLTQGGGKVIVTRGLAVAGRLDLKDNDLVLDYDPGQPNPIAAVEARIAAGYDFNAWDLNGIVTGMPDALSGLTTLAITDPVALFSMGPTETMEFSGQTVDGSSVLIKYTYAGDLNLDGLVDASDYGIIDNYFQFPRTSGYANGDFNFDGIIDAADYGLIDNAFQLQDGPL